MHTFLLTPVAQIDLPPIQLIVCGCSLTLESPWTQRYMGSLVDSHVIFRFAHMFRFPSENASCSESQLQLRQHIRTCHFAMQPRA